MRISIDDRWRIRAECAVYLPISSQEMWCHMQDLSRFLSMDPLHVQVLVEEAVSSTNSSPRGARLMLSHRLFGIGPDRTGRVLTWNQGRGFAISDLSRRGHTVGFPHICCYDIEPKGTDQCRLVVGVRGKWTAKWLPRILVKLWLHWVLGETIACLRREFARSRWSTPHQS